MLDNTTYMIRFTFHGNFSTFHYNFLFVDMGVATLTSSVVTFRRNVGAAYDTGDVVFSPCTSTYVHVPIGVNQLQFLI